MQNIVYLIFLKCLFNKISFKAKHYNFDHFDCECCLKVFLFFSTVINQNVLEILYTIYLINMSYTYLEVAELWSVIKNLHSTSEVLPALESLYKKIDFSLSNELSN